MLRFKSLGSGSSGNATLVHARSGTTSTTLLIDCGLGVRALERRAAQAGVALEDVDALFITHEHSDHIGCARSVARRHRIPVWMSAGTHQALREQDFDGLLRMAVHGQPITLGDLQINPFAVPHDAAEPLQLRCTDGQAHLGVLTDLGHVPEAVIQQLAGCRTVLLECNHDAEMLASGPYPWFLKQRVGGDWGHLANAAAAEAVRALQPLGLQQVVAAHLSQKNNHPDLAREAVAAALGCAPEEVGVADQESGTEWMEA